VPARLPALSTATLSVVTVLAFCCEARAQLPDPPPAPRVEVGLGRGLTVSAADGRSSLNIRVRIQIRATASGEGDDGREDLTEVSIRRMRLVFQGNAAGPILTYYVQLSFANLDMEPDLRLPLRDAYVTWSPSESIAIRIGQMKVPFSRQRVISSSALQMVDRSIVVSELNLDRDVGVQAFSRSLLGLNRLGYSVGVSSGLLYAGRLEAWPLGAFDDYVEGDVQRAASWRVALGASVGYNQNTNRPRSTIGTPYQAGDVDYRHAAIDLLIKKRGWSLMSEWLYREANRHSVGLVSSSQPTSPFSRSGWGAYVQGGRMVTDRLELTARYARMQPEDGTDPTFVTSREAGAGVNYYIAGHDLKVQGEYFRLTDPATSRGSHQARIQFQVYF
jgi:phosphate-selective porin OprO and OprP